MSRPPTDNSPLPLSTDGTVIHEQIYDDQKDTEEELYLFV